MSGRGKMMPQYKPIQRQQIGRIRRHSYLITYLTNEDFLPGIGKVGIPGSTDISYSDILIYST